MTNAQDLPTGLTAATRRHRGATLILLASGLCMACMPAMAASKNKTADAEKPAATEVAPATTTLPNTPPLAEPLPKTVSADATVKAEASAKDGQKTKSGLKAMASGAAASTLTLLLPHVAAGDDALPLLGRSTVVANDLGRLIVNADANKDASASGPSEKVQNLLKHALTLLGTPYRWGGTSPESGFDCSGLVSYLFRSTLGIELPRVSRDMAKKEDAKLIKSRDELREGDLVFFSRSKGRVDHVGIYLGEGKFVHSPRTGKDVEVSSLVTGYWAGKFLQARRVEM